MRYFLTLLTLLILKTNCTQLNKKQQNISFERLLNFMLSSMMVEYEKECE